MILGPSNKHADRTQNIGKAVSPSGYIITSNKNEQNFWEAAP